RGLLDQVVAPWFPRGVPWLTSPVLALPSVITVDIWKTTGYYMIVLLAGLLAIPIEYLEAAAIYGAGPWARVQHILLPLLRPQLVPLVFAVPIRWLPSARQWQNYVLPFQKTVGRYFLNSVIVLGAQTLGPLLLCSLAGYRLAKFRYPGRGLAFVFILSTVMLPIQVTLVPTFLIVKDLGWVNSCGGLIVPGLATSFATFRMREFSLPVPTPRLDADLHRRLRGQDAGRGWLDRSCGRRSWRRLGPWRTLVTERRLDSRWARATASLVRRNAFL